MSSSPDPTVGMLIASLLMTWSTSTDHRLVKNGAVRVRLSEVVDDRGADETGHDGEEDVVQSGSMTVVVVRGADAKTRTMSTAESV